MSAGFAASTRQTGSTRAGPPPPEVCNAWRRYLRETRAADADDYERAEERAWARLASSLATLGAPLDRLSG